MLLWPLADYMLIRHDSAYFSMNDNPCPSNCRQPSAAEEVLLSALRDSRRTVLSLQRIQKDVRPPDVLVNQQLMLSAAPVDRLQTCIVLCSCMCRDEGRLIGLAVTVLVTLPLLQVFDQHFRILWLRWRMPSSASSSSLSACTLRCKRRSPTRRA